MGGSQLLSPPPKLLGFILFLLCESLFDPRVLSLAVNRSRIFALFCLNLRFWLNCEGFACLVPVSCWFLMLLKMFLLGLLIQRSCWDYFFEKSGDSRITSPLYELSSSILTWSVFVWIPRVLMGLRGCWRFGAGVLWILDVIKGGFCRERSSRERGS